MKRYFYEFCFNIFEQDFIPEEIKRNWEDPIYPTGKGLNTHHEKMILWQRFKEFMIENKFIDILG